MDPDPLPVEPTYHCVETNFACLVVQLNRFLELEREEGGRVGYGAVRRGNVGCKKSVGRWRFALCYDTGPRFVTHSADLLISIIPRSIRRLRLECGMVGRSRRSCSRLFKELAPKAKSAALLPAICGIFCIQRYVLCKFLHILNFMHESMRRALLSMLLVKT